MNTENLTGPRIAWVLIFCFFANFLAWTVVSDPPTWMVISWSVAFGVIAGLTARWGARTFMGEEQ